MTDAVGQQELREIARALVGDLSNSESQLDHLNDTHHWHHSEFAARVQSLGRYLRSALLLAEELIYPQAYALLRCALEHFVIDELLFLADRYEQLTDSIDEPTWQRWQAAKPVEVVRWNRQTNGKVRIVWSGLHVRDSDGNPTRNTLSKYYYWWKNHNPFATPGRAHGAVAAGHPSDREDAASYAAVQDQIWRNAFTWQSLKLNLELNRLMDSRAIGQLDVHYRFLSAFVHPTSERAAQIPYPRNSSGAWPSLDHYSEELTLLYICFLAAEELKAFEEMSQRSPQVGLRNWRVIQEHITVAERASAHGWFPGRVPYSYDRVIEANQRAFDAVTALRAANQPLVAPTGIHPGDILDDEIRYYANPLRRLVDLHRGFHEVTTGLGWRSPWPRDDAGIR